MAVTKEKRRAPKPLDAEMLRQLGLNHVARYATTRGKLRSYLTRKLRERGWQGDDVPPVEAIVERMAALGYVDDRAFAEMRAAGLARRGYGPRRIADALRMAGIDEADGQAAREAAGAAAWDAALAFARRRRIGPFAADSPEPGPVRDKALAALMRAGHTFEIARILVDSEPGEVPEAPN